jgi:selenocysteine-specific elongation factor
MIIATAGHVDHGKTTLVKALTGVDTDRLEEEKRRGMSIDIGFAYTGTGERMLGFVDVPGHERFVRNMLAGVAAVDFALLVIAADDGPMPQTREHLAILDLLGIRQGAIALTKIDRVTPARLAEAMQEVAAMLADSPLHGAPVYPVAAATGDGVQRLREHLEAAAQAGSTRPVSGNFRLAIDRAFTLDGIGVIVTGAAFAGEARIGDQLVISPAGMTVRVRGIHANNQAAALAQAGQRCALNLTGADLRLEHIARGDWLVAPDMHAPTDRFDVRLTLLASEPRPLADGALVQLHAGAAVTGARLALLTKKSLAPGETMLAQCLTDKPVGLAHGDRFIIRDQSARRTLGGGHVIDPYGATRGRARPPRLAALDAADQPTAVHALEALLTLPDVEIDLEQFRRTWNLKADDVQSVLAGLPAQTVAAESGMRILAQNRWQAICERLCESLQDWHRRQPDSLGMSESALGASVGMAASRPVVHAALRRLVKEGRILRDRLHLRLPDHVPVLSERDARLLEKMQPILAEAGLRPPIVGELASTMAMPLSELLGYLERFHELGHLVKVAKNRFFLPVTVDCLARIAAQLAAETESDVPGERGFDAAQYRDRSGIGRNLTIEVLEYLDRAGVTRFAYGRRTMHA